MSDNIVLGIDPGVGSIGFFRRDISKKSIEEQLLGGTVLTFPAGVKSKDTTISNATERGNKRRQRNHNLSRKQCKWATLELLIKNEMCPLSVENLDKWRKYDKEAEVKHPYPTHDADYVAWLRCDFNHDGKPEYKMFELRHLLAINADIDLSTSSGKQMLGRVVYHMALHRGFRSSKGERATNNQDNRGVEDNDEYVGAEKEKSKKINALMNEENLPTVGCALYFLNEKKGERVRESDYTIIAKQNKDELRYIFKQHKELGEHRMKLCEKIIKTVFRVKPIPPQKDRVAKCLFERGKTRSPKSRPEFEEYRAWSFINNIRIGIDKPNEELSLELKEKLFEQSFWAKTYFDFKEIRIFIQNELCLEKIEANYGDDVEIAGCPIWWSLKKLLGEDWQNWNTELNDTRVNLRLKNKRGVKDKKRHQVVHTWETLWNVCFTGDKEDVETFCENRLKQSDKKWRTSLLKIMSLIAKSEGYSHISTHAIKKINKFLRLGFTLDKAILLANIPDIVGKEIWNNSSEVIEQEIANLYDEVKVNNKAVKITNNLISSYKKLCLDPECAFAVHDTSYKLDDIDKRDVENAVLEFINEQDENYNRIYSMVEGKYQSFFADSKRNYIKQDSLRDRLIIFLNDNFNCDATSLYNHALIEKYTYKPNKAENIDGNPVELLGEPQLHNLKNPVVLRTMYKMRNMLNYMLLQGKISNDTRLVIETAHDFNDANMRYAIKTYNDMRTIENVELEKIVSSILENYNDNDIRRARFAYEQSLGNGQKSYEYDDLSSRGLINENGTDDAENNEDKDNNGYKKKIVERYKLWKEQNFRCIYTGKIITLKDVLTGDNVDIEHTLPLSRSMDDSDKNKTLCDAHFNRHIKQNKLPSELGEEYEKYKENIKPWEERVKFLQGRVQYWQNRSKKAVDKASKDDAIRKMHIYRMEYDYWKGKVDRFTMPKIDVGFVHRQLSDTRTITKYLVEYLRVVFPNVSVQNSHITTAFREILDLPQKNRDNNLHHAQDAAILSMIPSSYMRDKLLELYYKTKDLEQNVKHLQEDVRNIKFENKKEKEAIVVCLEKDKKELADTIRRYNYVKKIANIDNDINTIINNKVDEIIVNHMATNRTLNKTRKKYRVRGKVVPLRDENWNVITDEHGNVVPWRWKQGNSVRGELCEDTFYGMIKVPQRGEDNKILHNKDGEVIYDKSFVKRAKAKTRKELKELINKDCIVDKKLQSHIQQQLKDGVKTIVDKNGKKIRHIRCFTSKNTSPFVVKQHRDYKSKYEYKNYSYTLTGNGANAFIAIYQNEKGNGIGLVSRLYDISQKKYKYINELFNKTLVEQDEEYKLKYIMKPGQRLIYRSKTLSICDLKNKELRDRLYILNNFTDEKLMIYHHTQSQYDPKKNTPLHIENLPISATIRFKKNPNCFWVEGYDFDIMPDGEIKIRQ